MLGRDVTKYRGVLPQCYSNFSWFTMPQYYYPQYNTLDLCRLCHNIHGAPQPQFHYLR